MLWIKERIVLLMPVLMLLVIVLRYILPLKPDTPHIEKKFWIQKTYPNKKFNIVIAGDSRIYRGIASEIMELKMPNYSVLNFGYSSGSMSKLMLRETDKKLNYNADRKIIILGITPHSLTPNACLDGHLKQELSRKREEIIETIYFGFIKQYFPTTTPYYILKHKLGNSSKKSEPIYHQYYRRNGWVASWKEPEDTTEAYDSYRKVFNNNQVSDSILVELVKYIKYWRNNNVLVFAFRPPTTYTMRQIEDSLSGYNEEKIKNIVEQAGAKWIAVNQTKYHSYDGSHLRLDGAIHFSKDLTDEIIQLIKEKY